MNDLTEWVERVRQLRQLAQDAWATAGSYEALLERLAEGLDADERRVVWSELMLMCGGEKWMI